MKSHIRRTKLLLGGAMVLGLVFFPLVLSGMVLGGDGGEKEPLPPGLVPATNHETVLVPAAPENPDAPAVTYEDPEPGLPGDESANRPIPDYLKGEPYRLSFVSGDYYPPQHERVDPRLVEGLGRFGRDHTYGYVMFRGAVQAHKVKTLEGLGLVFGSPHTFNCLQAWIPGRALAALRVHPFVRWVGYARSEQKADPLVLEAMNNPVNDPTRPVPVFVNVFDSDLGPWSEERSIDEVPPQVSVDPKEVAMRAMVTMSNGPFHRAIEAEGGRVMGYEDSIRTFYVWATPPTIRRIVGLDFVAGLDMALEPTPDHDRSIRVTSADYVGNLTSYCGKDTSVAIVDSGFHHAHSDLSQTYTLSWDYSGEAKPTVDNCGHGTHVAATVFGDGSARSDRRYRGSAPKTGTLANHAVYKLKVFKGDCNGGTNYPNYCPTAWTVTTKGYSSWSTLTLKSTVVQNSWGSGNRLSTGYYGTDTLSRACDTNTHTHRQLYVMSTGNSGGSSSTQYFKSTRPPNVAKSAFAVGSILDWDDTSGASGNRYPGAHRFSSSKGPTRDGRMKPQISAPGHMIVSAKTNTTTSYTAKSGTSMSTPHVSGVAAMMHDASSAYRTYPCLSRAKMMAAAAPYAGIHSWSSSSESYYNRRGMGQVDAYASIFSNNTAQGWTSGYAYRTLTRSSSGFYFDITIPSDAKRTFFVMSWDEKAPALNATKAVLYNLDLILDVYPFNPDINKGEYYSRNSVENYDWYGNISSISALRGKKVRVKIPFLKKPTSSSEVVRVGVVYHIPRGDYTPSASVTVTASPTKVKPGATVTATATAALKDYRANNLYMYLASGSGFTATTLRHTTRDSRTLTTDTVVSSARDSKMNWTLGEAGYWWSTTHRRLTWTLRAPSSSGSRTIRAYARGDSTASTSGYTTVCVDGLAPNRPSNVRSTTHATGAWTNRRSFTANWTAASDNGCAGMMGYGLKMSSGCSSPTIRNLGNVTTYSTTLPASAGSNWYLNIRSYDQVGNASSSTCVGPYRIDTVAPTSGKISINSGASTTRSLTVTLSSLGATETGSGLYRMRFSGNGSTWSSWQTYATSRTGWNLASYGGGSIPGLKRVYVQYQDRAGNVSLAALDTITYSPLDITSVSPNRGTLIGEDTVTLTGAGFASGARVYFGGASAAAVKVYSSTRITCRTPRRLSGGSVDVQVVVGSVSDKLTRGYTYVGASVVASGDPRLATPYPVTFSAPVDGGRTYVGAASFGTGPLLLSPHNPLYLSPDILFFLTVKNQVPTLFRNLQGVLNASGQGVCTVILPNIPAIVGLRFYMAFVSLDASKPLGVRTVSSTRGFRIQSRP